MRTKRFWTAPTVALLAILLIGSLWRTSRAQQEKLEAPPLAYAFGSQLTVYYPAQKKIYVYSELGGSCVYMYTLSTPGGTITRQNCK